MATDGFNGFNSKVNNSPKQCGSLCSGVYDWVNKRLPVEKFTKEHLT